MLKWVARPMQQRGPGPIPCTPFRSMAGRTASQGSTKREFRKARRAVPVEQKFMFVLCADCVSRLPPVFLDGTDGNRPKLGVC